MTIFPQTYARRPRSPSWGLRHVRLPQQPAEAGGAHQDEAVSKLEFIVAIKWPATVLILAIAGLIAMKRSPGKIAALMNWLRNRNFRINLMGQEFETTMSDIQSSMGVAAETDAELAAAVAGVIEKPAPEGPPVEPQEAVDAARRSAIENVMRTAARLGWKLAQSGATEPPEVKVVWADNGTPFISVNPAPASGNSTPSTADPFLRSPANWLQRLNAHNAQVLRDQESALRLLAMRSRTRPQAPTGEQPGEPL